ncbi:MAG: TetR/AcrR family transcriptional regulator [Deltaproteobacteria bacterium]|nr:MAG: TetR/AcrR family transcriptional regulator [Deltaproteobacteria bacterium]
MNPLGEASNRSVFLGRRRRSAEETKRIILDVAQDQLAAHGLDGMTLDAIAAEVGVSRQAVLHHFGSRAGLMRAVVGEAWGGLFSALSSLDASDLGPREFLDTVDQVVRKKGHARIGAWLLLSGKGLPPEVFEGVLAELPKQAEGRVPEGATQKDVEFGLLLVAAALFGDAIFGERLRQALGLPDGEEERESFRAWMAERLIGR